MPFLLQIRFYTPHIITSILSISGKISNNLIFRKQDGVEAELAIINVYCPRVDPDREDRLLYKLRFFALLQTRAEALLQSGW